jgi:guanylate kinase
MSAREGLLIVISGPAGSGKGTVLRRIFDSSKHGREFAFSVSATTRAPRPGEVDGVNYHYLTREDFEARIARDELLEYTEYCGNFYGTLKKETEAVLESGKNLILEIEVEGAMNIKRLCPDSAVLIMLLPPSYAIQEQRLRGRATETEEVIKRRLERTKEEMEYLPEYDYVVYNYDGQAEECAREIEGIVHAEKSAMRRNPDVKRNFFGIAE